MRDEFSDGFEPDDELDLEAVDEAVEPDEVSEPSDLEADDAPSDAGATKEPEGEAAKADEKPAEDPQKLIEKLSGDLKSRDMQLRGLAADRNYWKQKASESAEKPADKVAEGEDADDIGLENPISRMRAELEDAKAEGQRVKEEYETRQREARENQIINELSSELTTSRDEFIANAPDYDQAEAFAMDQVKNTFRNYYIGQGKNLSDGELNGLVRNEVASFLYDRKQAAQVLGVKFNASEQVYNWAAQNGYQKQVQAPAPLNPQVAAQMPAIPTNRPPTTLGQFSGGGSSGGDFSTSEFSDEW